MQPLSLTIAFTTYHIYLLFKIVTSLLNGNKNPYFKEYHEGHMKPKLSPTQNDSSLNPMFKYKDQKEKESEQKIDKIISNWDHNYPLMGIPLICPPLQSCTKSHLFSPSGMTNPMKKYIFKRFGFSFFILSRLINLKTIQHMKTQPTLTFSNFTHSKVE